MKTFLALEVDRLFGTLYKKPTMSQETDALKDQIEDLHLQILDINESRTVMRDLLEARERQVKQLDEQLEAIRKVRLEQSAAVARCTALEGENKRLKMDLDICYKNNSHVQELLKGKEAICQEAMKIVDGMRDKVKKGDVAVGQAEHLARQVLRLQEENENLRKDYARMMGDFHDIKEEFPKLKEDNELYRQQVTRLVNELAQLECAGAKAGRTDAMCGGCLACQLQQAQHIISQTSDNVAQRNKERDDLKDQLVRTLDSHENNRKLIRCLSDEVNNLKHILRICRDALGEAFHAWPWQRKAIIRRALNDRMEYMKIHNMNGDC